MWHPTASSIPLSGYFNLPVAGETLDRYAVSIHPFSRRPDYKQGVRTTTMRNNRCNPAPESASIRMKDTMERFRI
jgi:hypothetical protein